jgi:glyceraldehyde 3-phosphate dehydrogenase
MSRVAIHGFGRIGHSLMKAALDGDVFVPVSISDIKDIETPAALFEVERQLRALVRAGRDKART